VRRVAGHTTDLRRRLPELVPVLRRPAPTLRQVSQRLPFFHPRWNEAYGWRAAGALATLSASTFAFAYLAENYVTNDPLVRWDARFNHWLNDEAWGPLVRLFEAVTLTGSSLFLLALTGAAVALSLSRGDRPDALLLSSAFVGAETLNIVLKLGFERPRPPFHDPELTVSTFSFPSGHASASVAVYGAFAIVLLRSITRWTHRAIVLSTLAVLLALIGFSRIYLGAHYFSDVLAGYSVGAAWLAFCVLAITVQQGRVNPPPIVPLGRRRG
jgi:membrane-associated phospholipid phosphatase